MRSRKEKPLSTARPRRGTPAQTRERLVAAAAILFNRAGYHGTDSNRIARAAGYSTGTFYKHFKDKREIFLAAYETWVASEWKAVATELSAGGAPRRHCAPACEPLRRFSYSMAGIAGFAARAGFHG
jgi:AcrR family transcriptional regulator